MSGHGELTAGVDIGTTSVKAVVVDGDGSVLARARVTHPVLAPAEGDFTHDPDQAWRAGVLDALGQVLAPGHEIAAVAMSAMVPSLGAFAADGAALGPGLLYGDRRGRRPDHQPSFPGDEGEAQGFLAWQAAHHPEANAYWPAQAAANHALCGSGAIDLATAMTTFPLFDLERWDESLVAAAGTSTATLARVLSGIEPAGRVAAGRPGEGALVSGGTVDALAEQLVSGARSVGDVLVLCGTTLITWAVTDPGLGAPGLWAMPHHIGGLGLLGGPSNAGGMFIDMVSRWVGSSVAGLDDAGPADLPIWLPYVRGERTPLHRPELRASLHDVSRRHGPAHLVAAAYEASAFVVRHHLDLACDAGFLPRRIVASGGGTRSEPWMQALADVTGLPVDVAALPEGAALGAAFLARCTAGLESSPSDATRWAQTDRTVRPRASWIVDAVDGRYQRFRRLTAEAVAH